VSKVTEIVKQKFYWPNLESDVRIAVAQCRECLARKVTANKLHPSCPTITSYPFEKIAIDIAGPLPRSRGGESYILAIVDYFSKFPMLVPIRQVDAKTVADVVFKQWICLFGAPNSIHTDRGTAFESALFKEMCAIAGVIKSKTAPYYPQSDGLVERQFRTVKDMLYATSKTYNRDWAEVIPLVEIGLRSSIQKTNKISPFQVIFGKQMKLPVQWQFPADIQENRGRYTVNSAGRSEYIIDLQRKLSTIHDSLMQRIKQKIVPQHTSMINKRSGKPYQLGDKCMARILPVLKNINSPCYQGPYLVSRRLGDWTYELEHVLTGEKIERNYYHLKPWRSIKQIYSTHSKRPSSRLQQNTSKKNEQKREKRNIQRPERYGFTRALF
jgi:transposase InsO family protein